MASDSDEEYDDLDFDNGSDAEEDIDEDILDALEGDLAAAAAAEGSEGEEVSSAFVFAPSVNILRYLCSGYRL